MGKVVVFLLAAVVLTAVVYVVQNQVPGSGSVNFSSPFLKDYRDLLPPLPEGFGELEPHSVVRFETDSSGTRVEFNARGTETPSVPPPPPPEQPSVVPPYGFTLAQLSPFYKKFSIADIVTFRGRNETTRFSIVADRSLDQQVSVTGWVLKGRYGELARIPTALSLYSIDAPGMAENVTLGSGDSVMIIGASSPAGENFRLNLCTGYLNTRFSNTFEPRLPEQCPRLFQPADYAHLGGTCRSFVSGFGGCRVPTTEEINAYAFYDNGACSQFLARFRYGECVNRFRSRADFYSGEWRVWLNRYIDLRYDHDRLLLFDRNGLLVAEYDY
ncbi:MAG: hypothetical protein AAB601_02820 [Patescibacteria group bacterium]